MNHRVNPNIIILCIVFLYVVPSTVYGQSNEHIIESINALRARHGTNSLNEHELLSKTAEQYASVLADSDHFSHNDLQGDRAVDRFRRNGGTSIQVGEVLAVTEENTIDNVLSAWLKSQTHAELITSSSWTHIGVGYKRNGEHLLYIVLLFIKKPFYHLHASWEDDRLLITGTFSEYDAVPILLFNDEILAPDTWDSDSGKFAFSLTEKKLIYYCTFGCKHGEEITFTDTYIFEQ